MKKKFTATKLYIVINILIFLLIYLKDPRVSIITLIDFGAQNGFSLADGKLWHLVMPMFLHASWQHLGLNCLSIYIFGRFVESYYGSKPFVFISLVIGVLASLGSFLTQPRVSVGASGVVYGYFAFHLYLYFLNKERYKASFGSDIFILLAINIGYSIFGANIDMAGHLFGLAGGFIIFLLLDKKKVKRSSKVLLTSLLLIFALLSGARIVSYRGSEDYYLSKIYYYDQKKEPILRDELIKEYIQRYSSP
ncbi:MAG: rhomboid family intramembrane serine protease [Tissierellia bacterium]|nr:rhomboid family intramembrane serine protease [Tissierellia bacterium]